MPTSITVTVVVVKTCCSGQFVILSMTLVSSPFSHHQVTFINVVEVVAHVCRA